MEPFHPVSRLFASRDMRMTIQPKNIPLRCRTPPLPKIGRTHSLLWLPTGARWVGWVQRRELAQEYNLRDGTDSRLLKLTGKPYTARDAYAALDCTHDSPDVHGRRIWGTRVPNKVKVFTWLYFKDRLSTRVNLHSKHVVDDDHCQRCSASLEDRHHVFFACSASADLWGEIGLSNTASLSDAEIWNSNVPPGLDASIWPFILLTILWRLWDARNGEIFRNKPLAAVL
ncbi:unnamed protein product [Miscanthus lutarioriparius]|uniref:Reverse transcriptase zinc-binding domain-containing protein n=1 Tax=Miscanthus lutarioriparius TaxID=422564 RepID=A0A811PXE5_9POAL|nr:unnamed protein product [Miscanthus lutarioriparius]